MCHYGFLTEAAHFLFQKLECNREKPLYCGYSTVFDKKKKTDYSIKIVSLIWCRCPGSNRYGNLFPRDFKSRASANSATSAYQQQNILYIIFLYLSIVFFKFFAKLQKFNAKATSMVYHSLPLFKIHKYNNKLLPAIAATSAAKSSSFFSRPSPVS